MPNIYLFIAFLFGISLSLFLLGGQTALSGYMDRYKDVPNTPNMLEFIVGFILNNQFALLAGGLLGFGVGFATGNLYAIIPFALAGAIMNLLVFPIDVSILPYPLNIVMLLFFNISIFVVLVSFMRSG